MSLTPSGLEEIVTLTLENRSGELADNITDNNALLKKLRENGNNRPVGGGYEIREELEYAENATAMWYSGAEVLNIAPQTVFAHATFTLKQAAIAVTITGLEMLQNSGKQQVIDLVASKTRNAERSFKNFMGTAIYSDGSAYSGKQIAGLQHLVSDAGTGTVGGLNSSTYSWWQNAVYDFSANSVAASSATITAAMDSLYYSIVRGSDKPDLIVADNNYFSFYEQSLRSMQRFTSDAQASAGFDTLRYKGADVVLDGGKGGNCPANHMYMLNTKYLFFRPHSDRNMKVIGGERQSVNQDVVTKIMAFAGNMTISNRSLQGVIVA